MITDCMSDEELEKISSIEYQLEKVEQLELENMEYKKENLEYKKENKEYKKENLEKDKTIAQLQKENNKLKAQLGK